MGDIKKKEIKLTSLSVSIENPRFEMATSQREAIQMMVADQSDKLIKLAKDILDSGLNPGDPVFVTPEKDKSARFTVLEGNRRISILKILNSPEILDGKNASFLNKLKPHLEAFKKSPILTVECVVYEDPADADKWIELKHTGENSGVGTVSWDTTQQARFNKKVKGHNPIALQAIEFLERSNYTDEKLKQDLPKLSYTNMERLLTDPDVRETLGIKYHNRTLRSDLYEAEVIKGLSKIAGDFLYKNYTVNNIRSKKDRKQYLEEFSKETLPNKSNKASSPWQLISSAVKLDTPVSEPKVPAKKSIPGSLDRKTLIPRDCIMSIPDRRVNSIYRELKDLSVADYVNATSVMLRVFIELSIDAFLESKKGKIKGIKKMTPLKDKLEAVVTYLEASRAMTEEELKAIKVSINEPHSMMSIDTFNAYVHNRHYSPDERALKNSWDIFQIFVEKLWENTK